MQMFTDVVEERPHTILHTSRYAFVLGHFD